MPEYFHILPPQQVPEPARPGSTHIDEPIKRLTGDWVNDGFIDNAHAIDSASQLLSNLSMFSQHQHSELLNERDRLSPDDSIHDDYFGIRRIGGPSLSIFLQTILRANLTLYLDTWESPFVTSSEKLNLLDRALSTTFFWVLGTEPPSFPRIKIWRSQGVKHHSMLRWVRGHQIFAALTQGLIAAFRDLSQAMQQEDDERMEKAADLAALLLDASAVSFEFTGDFPAADYNDIIRPSMAPPVMPETFSGLLSVDHRFLVHLMRQMKPQLDDLAEFHPDHHQRIASALSHVYDSHRFVCSRLVGKCPSLMMATGSKKSGAEQIEKFKHLRLKVFEPEKTLQG